MAKFDWNHPYIIDYVIASKLMLRYWKLHIPVPEKEHSDYYLKLHQLRCWLDSQGLQMRKRKL